MKLRFGPGGTAGMGYEKGLPFIAGLGLDALEVEFTHGVQMSNDTAKKLGEIASMHNVFLSIHAPYYVNLCSPDKEKVKASVGRILASCERGHHMGARYVVFHPGFYQKKPADVAYEDVKVQIELMHDKIKDNGWKLKLAPETTGKPSQFGSVEELLRLHKETKCHACIDFAHLRARLAGEIDYDEVVRKVKALGHVHAHFSGIEWGDKGEKRHVLTSKDVIRPLAEAVIKNKVDLTLINESPDPIKDAVKCKEVFEEIL